MADDRSMSQLPPHDSGSHHTGLNPGPVSPTPCSAAAVAAIVLAGVVFVGAVALIYYRGLMVDVPTSQIVVEGTEQLDGAVVSLDGTGLRRPLKSTLSEEGDFLAKFYVVGGVYRVVVTHPLGTVSEDIALKDQRIRYVSLKDHYPSLESDPRPQKASSLEAGSSGGR